MNNKKYQNMIRQAENKWKYTLENKAKQKNLYFFNGQLILC
ncbi:MAG: hypothetical protein ACTSQF_08540 [Candidatus Heimdallarchaeaceae archaeon]